MAGDLLLKGAFIASFSLIAVLFLSETKMRKYRQKDFKALSRALFTLLTFSLLLLLYLFYKTDFNINYVFSKSSTFTPLIYRLSAVWVGQEGVFLVWAWAISICILYLSERKGFKESLVRRTVFTLGVLCGFFILLTILMAPFETTIKAMERSLAGTGTTVEQALLNMETNGFYESGKGFIQGRGMSPSLMSPWMALHPPILFMAYAFAAVVFSSSILRLLRMESNWEEFSRQWARLSWAFLTSGLIFGSFWAYEELSFGGYWTWDPIETASLLPWLTLTVFLHSSYEHRRKGVFGLTGPFFGALTTILIIYGTFITKSGLVESSHAFGKSIITPFLTTAVFLSVSILFFSAARQYQKEKKMKVKDFKPFISTTNAFYLSTILFILLLAVLIWGITYPLYAKVTAGKTVAISKAFYNNKGYPFTVGVFLLMGFCLLLWVLKKQSALAVSLSVLGISLAGYLLKPTGNTFLDTFIPIGIYASLAAVIRLQREAAFKKKNSVILKGIASHLLHLGMAIMLTGVVLSSSLQTGTDLLYPYPEGIGSEMEAGSAYTVKLVNLFVYQDDVGNWVQQVNVSVFKDGSDAIDLSLLFVNDRRFGRYPKVTIMRGLTSDLYLVYYGLAGGHDQGTTLLPVNARVIPFVSLVWLGSILALIGAVARFILETIYSKSPV